MMEHKNTMGSKVAQGFKCKPETLDPNKPMMHYKTQIFICSSPRCTAVSRENLADELREITKEMGLNRGKNRIKITRSKCFGACRHKQVAQITENTKRNGYLPNNAIWLKGIHQYDKEKFRELFTLLNQNKNIEDYDFEQVPMDQIE